MQDDSCAEPSLIWLCVPRHLVKTAKSALESKGVLSRSSKIRNVVPDAASTEGSRFVVPTTLSYDYHQQSVVELGKEIASLQTLTLLSLEDYFKDIEVFPDDVGGQRNSSKAADIAKPPKAPSQLTGGSKGNASLAGSRDTSLPEELSNFFYHGINRTWDHHFVRYSPLMLITLSNEKNVPLNRLISEFPEHAQLLFRILCEKMKVNGHPYL